ncbi:MAG TPA: hypothetical protein P5079_10840, partial [Elusimicrobiota bacterium]|nr:hypothetical protein [Elusimicrobiota bacterium]
MPHRFSRCFAAVCSCLLLSLFINAPSGLRAANPLYLELSAHGDRIDLGLAAFSTSRTLVEEAAIAREMQEVTRQDLIFPRIFNLIEGGVPPVRKKVLLDSWSRLGADVVVTGYVDTGWFGR